MKTLMRSQYARNNDTGYRYTCPFDHVTVKLLQLPEVKKRGNNLRREVFEHHNGKEYEGMFRCSTCNETYPHVYDKKENEWVTINPPRK